MRKVYLIAGIATAAVAIGCGIDSSPSSEPQDSQRLNDNANSNTGKASVSPASNLIIAGDWEVGKKDDIKGGVITPGTYIITASSNGINCYWKTVKSFDGDFDSIIANGNIDPGTTARVVVKSSYAGLTLQGDCLAKKKGS